MEKNKSKNSNKTTKTSENEDIFLTLINDPNVSSEQIEKFNVALTEYSTIVEDPIYVLKNKKQMRKKLRSIKEYIVKCINKDEYTDEAIDMIKNNSYVQYLELMTK